MEHLTRAIAALVPAVPLSLFGLGVTAGPASAAATTVAPSVTCSNYGCDGTDPDETGCTYLAYAVFDINGLQLMWSPTCKTNWARYYVNPGETAILGVTRQNPYGYKSLGSSVAGWAYTDQLYSPGPARASVTVINKAQWFTPWTD
ncbi:DUF2690 domain-containing protein [Actinoallomurus iriomotensis]|uniref:DUF2690 domain-containing protein n=1 Tax=Actinoallomurus iriomotensis TaxID=478107 RepID=A0A9W6VPV6_9ACTN|nr:DUF2690 domain-containing protein [Actinoallomurus iriomotensis]GLY75234.1 hypothetical protein Airi01_035010 [Actinoallomurus iriomotensis]